MTGLMYFLCGIGVMWCLTKLNSKYKLNFIDEECSEGYGMTLYENLEEFCSNYVNYWNTNEELEDLGIYNKELHKLLNESVDDIENTIKEIRKE